MTSIHINDAKPHTDWVTCPICDEHDMRKEVDEDGASLIFCVNHNCGSNGGTNFCGIEKRAHAKQAPLGQRLTHSDMAVLSAANPQTIVEPADSEDSDDDLPPLPQPLAYGFLDTQMRQYGLACIAQYKREREGDMLSLEWKGGYSAGYAAGYKMFEMNSKAAGVVAVKSDFKQNINAYCNDLLDCAAQLHDNGAFMDVVAEMRRTVANIRTVIGTHVSA